MKTRKIIQKRSEPIVAIVMGHKIAHIFSAFLSISRLLESAKKDITGRLIETFSKYPDQDVYRDSKSVT